MSTTTRDAELLALDEEIAMLRGWFTTDYGSWTPRAGDPCAYVMDDQLRDWSEHAPPPFSSSWALAGLLLEEMAQGVLIPGVLACPCTYRADHDPLAKWIAGDVVGADERGCSCDGIHHGATPTEAICRAWLAWRKG